VLQWILVVNCVFRYAKLVLSNGRVQGALFVSQGDGEHDVETFENLILSQVTLLCFCVML